MQSSFSVLLGHLCAERSKERQDAWKRFKDFVLQGTIGFSSSEVSSIFHGITKFLKLEYRNEAPASTVQVNKLALLLKDIRNILSKADDCYPNSEAGTAVIEFTATILELIRSSTEGSQNHIKIELLQILNSFVFSHKSYVLLHSKSAILRIFLLYLAKQAVQTNDMRLISEILETLFLTRLVYSAFLDDFSISSNIFQSIFDILNSPALAVSCPNYSLGISAIHFCSSIRPEAAKACNFDGKPRQSLFDLIQKTLFPENYSVRQESSVMCLSLNISYPHSFICDMMDLFLESKSKPRVSRHSFDPFEVVSFIIEFSRMSTKSCTMDISSEILQCFAICLKFGITFSCITKILNSTNLFPEFTILLCCIFCTNNVDVEIGNTIISRMFDLFDSISTTKLDHLLAIVASAITFGWISEKECFEWVLKSKRLLRRPQLILPSCIFLRHVILKFPNLSLLLDNFELINLGSPLRRQAYAFIFDQFLSTHGFSMWNKSAQKDIFQILKHFVEELSLISGDKRQLQERLLYYIEQSFVFMSLAISGIPLKPNGTFRFPGLRLSHSIAFKVFHNTESKKIILESVKNFEMEVSNLLHAIEPEILVSIVSNRYEIENLQKDVCINIILTPIRLLLPGNNSLNDVKDYWNSFAFIRLLCDSMLVMGSESLENLLSSNLGLQLIIRIFESLKGNISNFQNRSEKCSTYLTCTYSYSRYRPFVNSNSQDPIFKLIQCLCHIISNGLFRDIKVRNDLVLYLSSQLHYFVFKSDILDLIVHTITKIPSTNTHLAGKLIGFCETLLLHSVFIHDHYAHFLVACVTKYVASFSSLDQFESLSKISLFLMDLLHSSECLDDEFQVKIIGIFLSLMRSNRRSFISDQKVLSYLKFSEVHRYITIPTSIFCDILSLVEKVLIKLQ